MSTRAIIGYKNPNGKITGIYSHWDGYETGLGLNIMKFFPNTQGVIHLIDGGDISQIDWKTGQPSYYAQRGSWRTWNEVNKCYDDNRGGEDAKWEDVKPHTYKDLIDFIDTMNGDNMIELMYLHDNGKWRGFKSDYKSNVIQEFKMDQKKFQKARDIDKTYPKVKVIETYTLPKIKEVA